MFSVFVRSDDQEMPKRIPLPAIGGGGGYYLLLPGQTIRKNLIRNRAEIT